METNLGVEDLQSSLVLSLRGKNKHRHGAGDRSRDQADMLTLSLAGAYLLDEIQSPVPVVVAGQDVRGLESHTVDLRATR